MVTCTSENWWIIRWMEKAYTLREMAQSIQGILLTMHLMEKGLKNGKMELISKGTTSRALRMGMGCSFSQIKVNTREVSNRTSSGERELWPEKTGPNTSETGSKEFFNHLPQLSQRTVTNTLVILIKCSSMAKAHKQIMEKILSEILKTGNQTGKLQLRIKMGKFSMRCTRMGNLNHGCWMERTPALRIV